MKDKRSKSIYKALSWRLMATATTMSVVLVLTGKLDWALEIGALDFVVKLALYYGHERIWNRWQ